MLAFLKPCPQGSPAQELVFCAFKGPHGPGANNAGCEPPLPPLAEFPVAGKVREPRPAGSKGLCGCRRKGFEFENRFVRAAAFGSYAPSIGTTFRSALNPNRGAPARIASLINDGARCP